jgi:hypothetical protein
MICCAICGCISRCSCRCLDSHIACSGFLPWWSNDVGTNNGFSVLSETRRAVVLFIEPQLIAPCCCCDGGKGDLLVDSSSIKGPLVLDIRNCGRSNASNQNNKSKTLWSVHAWGCISLDLDICIQVEQGTHIVLHNNSMLSFGGCRESCSGTSKMFLQNFGTLCLTDDLQVLHAFKCSLHCSILLLILCHLVPSLQLEVLVG